MGKIKKRTGKSGNNIIIEVPVGTCIYDSKSGELISDLKYPEQYIVVAAGGKGGGREMQGLLPLLCKHLGFQKRSPRRI